MDIQEVKQHLCGPMIPIITNLHDDLSIDTEAIQSNVRYVIDRGFVTGKGVLLAVGAGIAAMVVPLAGHPARLAMLASLSAILVVPGDMAMDLGLGPNPAGQNHPEVDDAFQTVLEACLAQDRVICGIGDGASRLEQRLDEGWRFVLPLGG